MDQFVGRIEVLADPPALARRLAVDDRDGLGGKRAFSGRALRGIDAQGALQPSGLGGIPRPFPLAAGLLVLGR